MQKILKVATFAALTGLPASSWYFDFTFEDVVDWASGSMIFAIMFATGILYGLWNLPVTRHKILQAAAALQRARLRKQIDSPQKDLGRRSISLSARILEMSSRFHIELSNLHHSNAGEHEWEAWSNRFDSEFEAKFASEARFLYQEFQKLGAIEERDMWEVRRPYAGNDPFGAIAARLATLGRALAEK